jgi:hypothetical protein
MGEEFSLLTFSSHEIKSRLHLAVHGGGSQSAFVVFTCFVKDSLLQGVRWPFEA